MGLWHRVFGRSEERVRPDDLLAYLQAQGAVVTGRFDGGDDWWGAEIALAETMPLSLERFAAAEEGIRAELNSWAAYLETCDDEPNHAPLMERVIQTRQLFTLHRPVDDCGEPWCVALCQYLARATDGVFQVDGQGFFAADGTPLLRER
jgi:hypothetical protein